ncbi:MAG: FAD-dependent thymidylate synthase [Clostridiales bacterium]|nr:FAD-dependent thymidylate synthase [Clostridiales bacterium]
MNIIKPYAEILSETDYNEILRLVELAGRVCYKSEQNISDGSAEKFVSAIIRRGHESVIEHFSVSVRFIVDRGISHEIVRHRIASFSQESTRYCNYSQEKFGRELTFIAPCFFTEQSIQQKLWEQSVREAEISYFKLLDSGAKPEEARSVLPNSVKTELVMTANLREWRHFMKLRTAPAAHPQMREVAKPLLAEFKKRYCVFFEDIAE